MVSARGLAKSKEEMGFFSHHLDIFRLGGPEILEQKLVVGIKELVVVLKDGCQEAQERL